jgi:3-oxoacyl-(acyl-carrier-protein) synthase
MALFAQYAYAAAQEAIDDAGISSMNDDERSKIVGCVTSATT